jgi:excisionase family DNA binding protein
MEAHLLTVLQAANRAGVSESLVYEWCKQKLLPHFRFGVKGKGGKIMIDPDEFDSFLASCKIGKRVEADGGEEEELTFLK